MKIMVKEVGKPLAVVDTKEKYFGDCVRSYLGKDITVERVYLDGTEFMMGVDEDGLMKQLPLNFLMSMQNPIYPVQYITKVLCGWQFRKLCTINKYLFPHSFKLWGKV